MTDETIEMYATTCDAIERALYIDADPGDGMLHTSADARRVATSVFLALGLFDQ